jgi:hypothetical protein
LAESTLSKNLTRLQRSVARELGYASLVTSGGVQTRDPVTALTGLKAYMLVDINDTINDGLEIVHGCNDWFFLRLPIEIPLYASYATGTITVVNGVVTLSGGTFPAWAADGELVTGASYNVATRDSGTQLTLVDTTLNANAGTSYTLYQNRYTLPDDFGGFRDQLLTYQPSDDLIFYRVSLVSPERIRILRQINQWFDRPRLAAERPKRVAGSSGQRSELVFWPPSATVARLFGRYRVHPDMLTSDVPYTYGGPLLGQLILAACCHIANRHNKSYDGRHRREFDTLLPEAVARDAEQHAPKSLGYDMGASPSIRWHEDGAEYTDWGRGMPDLFLT